MTIPATLRQPRAGSHQRPALGRTSVQARVAAFALVLASNGPALAHTHALAQTPPPNASVASPAQACINFSDALEPALSHLTVHDTHGNQVNRSASTVGAGQPTKMCADLPVLAPGSYQVRWVAVARDGHRTEGIYTFHVR